MVKNGNKHQQIWNRSKNLIFYKFTLASAFGMLYITSMANSIQFQSAYTLNLEVIAGCTVMANHPEYWRADISVSRLENSAEQCGSFVFVFIKDRVTYAYGISAQELLNACRTHAVSVNTSGTPRFQLYIAYATGEIFKSSSRSNLVVQLRSN